MYIAFGNGLCIFSILSVIIQFSVFYLFEITDADTSLAEAAVLAQHEQQYTEEKRDEEKRSRKSSTSSAASHASSTSSKASSTKGYPLKEDVDDGEGRNQQHTYTNKM